MKTILLIHNGENKGEVNFTDAQLLADREGLDLAKVGENDDLPIYKIQDTGKVQYEMRRKKKCSPEAKAKKTIQKNKTKKPKVIKLRPAIGKGDILVKAKQVDGFLKKKYKVNLLMSFRGREYTHTDIGVEVLDLFLSNITQKFEVIKTKSENQILYKIEPQ